MTVESVLFIRLRGYRYGIPFFTGVFRVMTAPNTRISIIIPSYNYARYLPVAVKSALAQKSDGIDVEVIIVDDGSTDGTATVVVKNFGRTVRYIRQDNAGPSAARNAGIRAATGDFVLFLDADDFLTSGNLASHLRNFAKHPELDISVGLSLQAFVDDADGEYQDPYVWPLKAAHLDLHLCYSNISPVHTFMVRSETIQQVGFFDTSLRACEDQNYWLRCAARGKCFGATTEALVVYRKHSGSSQCNRAREWAHSARMHLLTTKLLTESPRWPAAGKFLGWLAHGAGELECVPSHLQYDATDGGNLLADGITCLISAAASGNFTAQDAHLAVSAQYYAATAIGALRLLQAALPPQGQKMQLWLQKRYPHLAGLDSEKLGKRKAQFFNKLCCDKAEMQATVSAKLG